MCVCARTREMCTIPAPPPNPRKGVQVKVCRGSGKPGWLFLTSALPPSGLKPAQALLGPKGPALPSALSVSPGPAQDSGIDAQESDLCCLLRDMPLGESSGHLCL